MHILSALNAKIHISVEGKIVLRRWMINKMQVHLNHNNLFALTAVKFQYKIAQNMEKISYNLNANSVVQLLNGFVGETHIFANHVIKSNVMEIM